MKKLIRNIFAIISLCIGVIGGFIPILQGWVFVLIGFILLDFKKKEEWEHKILLLLGKTKIGKKLVELWKRVKVKNKDAIENKNKNISDIYKSIDKKNLEE